MGTIFTHGGIQSLRPNHQHSPVTLGDKKVRSITFRASLLFITGQLKTYSIHLYCCTVSIYLPIDSTAR